MASGNDQAIADAYNLPAVPDFWYWRRSVPSEEYRRVLVGSEVEQLTAGKITSFEWLTGNLTLPIDASDATTQTTLGSIFAAGTTSRANLLALVRGRATRAEQLFATGTGTVATPALRTFEGLLTHLDIAAALA